MNLSEFLEGIRHCPDEFTFENNERIPRLMKEYGINDNLSFTAYLPDYESWFNKMKKKYRFEKSFRPTFRYLNGTTFQANDHVNKLFVDFRLWNMLNQYNSTIILNGPVWNSHDLKKNSDKEVLSNFRHIANLTIELSDNLRINSTRFLIQPVEKDLIMYQGDI